MSAILDRLPPVSRRGATVAAFFDVDNTLLPGASAERLFTRELIARRLLGPGALGGTAAVVVRHLLSGPRHALRRHRPYLRGREVGEIARLGAEVCATRLVPRLAPCGLARLREHLDAGHHVALLSGAPAFLLEPLARALGLAYVLPSPLAVRDGRYTGELAGIHPYGEGKAVLARRHTAEFGLDLTASFGYADHLSDLPFLLAVGRPVCVNAGARLRALARQSRWPVVEWTLAGEAPGAEPTRQGNKGARQA